MGNTSNWDDGKKKWSETKDDLLSCYLSVFFQKVYTRNCPVLYVDGFSGCGVYGDGTKGSPLLALEAARHAQEQSRHGKVPITEFVFSEKSKRRAASLRDAIASDDGALSSLSEVSIETRGYSQAISEAVSVRDRFGTFFFYVDPFGISDLDFAMFRSISKINGEREPGVEVLLNFNSVGFLREACYVMKIENKIPEETSDSEESMEGTAKDRDERLTRIIGSESWHSTLEDLRAGLIDFWKAEDDISGKFTQRLTNEGFSFVLDMPIRDLSKRTDRGGLLKYRMVHMTNHWMGCAAMNDNMVGRSSSTTTPQLFQVDVAGNLVSDDDIIKEAIALVSAAKSGAEFSMGFLAACIVSRVGVVKKIHDINAIVVPKLEESGLVERVEKHTKTGRPKSSFSDKDSLRRI